MAKFAAACAAARAWSLAAPSSSPFQQQQQEKEPSLPSLVAWSRWLRTALTEAGSYWYDSRFPWAVIAAPEIIPRLRSAIARARDADSRRATGSVVHNNDGAMDSVVHGNDDDAMDSVAHGNDDAMDGVAVSAPAPTRTSIPDPARASIADPARASIPDPARASIADPARASTADPARISSATSTSAWVVAAAEHELLMWELGQTKKVAEAREAWRALACRTGYIPSLAEALRRCAEAAGERSRSLGSSTKEKRLELTQIDEAEAKADTPVVAAALTAIEQHLAAASARSQADDASSGNSNNDDDDVGALLRQLREFKSAATKPEDVAPRLAACVAAWAARPASTAPTALASLWAARSDDVASLFGVPGRAGFGPSGAAARAALVARIDAADDPVGLLLQGLLYDHGRLVPRDAGRAVRCYRSAAAAGLTQAQLCLALALALDGGDINTADGSSSSSGGGSSSATAAMAAREAVECARAASAGGEPLASLVLGWWYEYGWDAGHVEPNLSVAAAAYSAIPGKARNVFYDRQLTDKHGGWDRLLQYMPPKAGDGPSAPSAALGPAAVADPTDHGMLDLLAVPIVQLRVARLLGSRRPALSRIVFNKAAGALQYWEPLQFFTTRSRPLVARQDFSWIPRDALEALATAERTAIGLHMQGEHAEYEATGPLEPRLHRALELYQAAATAGNPLSYAACGRVVEKLGATSTWRFEAAALYLAGCVAGDTGAWAPLAWAIDALLPPGDPSAVVCWPEGPLQPAPLRSPTVAAFLAEGNVRLDRGLAVALALVAAAREDGLAMIFLGDELDRAGRSDIARVAYESAALNCGSARALRRLALQRLRVGAPDDVDAAAGLLRRAVAAGDDVSWLYLAGLYATGDAVPRDTSGTSASASASASASEQPKQPHQHGRALRLLQTGASLLTARLQAGAGVFIGPDRPPAPTTATQLTAAVELLRLGAHDVEAAPRLAAALAPLLPGRADEATGNGHAGDSRWAGLPTELLQRILNELAPEELVAVRGVCRSWRTHVLALEALDVSNVHSCRAAGAQYTNFRGQEPDKRRAGGSLVYGAAAVLCACGALVTTSDIVAADMPHYVSSNQREAYLRALGGPLERARANYARKHGGLLPPVRWATLAQVAADARVCAERITEAGLTGTVMIALLVRPAQPHWRSQYGWDALRVGVPAHLPLPTSPDAWAALAVAVLGGPSSDAAPIVELEDRRHPAWHINDPSCAQTLLTAAGAAVFRWSDYAPALLALRHQLQAPAAAVGPIIRSAFGPNMRPENQWHRELYRHHSWSHSPDANEWIGWLTVEAEKATRLATVVPSPGIVVLVQAPLPLLVAPCFAHQGHLALAVCELWKTDS